MMIKPDFSMDILRKRPGVSCRIHCGVLFDPIPKRYGVHEGTFPQQFSKFMFVKYDFGRFFISEMNGNESIYATH